MYFDCFIFFSNYVCTILRCTIKIHFHNHHSLITSTIDQWPIMLIYLSPDVDIVTIRPEDAAAPCGHLLDSFMAVKWFSSICAYEWGDDTWWQIEESRWQQE